jgi:endonuclease III
MDICKGITKKKTRCTKKGRYDGYCKTHNPQFRRERNENIVEVYGLIEGRYPNDPWKVIVSCILLNLTCCHQVRPMISDFFKKYDKPEDIINDDDENIKEMIKPLGLYNRRTKTLKKFSIDYLNNVSIEKCYGVGLYAYQAYLIFIKNKMNFIPKDGALKAYIEKIKNGYEKK